MKYRVVHTTNYTYSAPVSICQNLVTLTPRDSERLRCQSHRLVIRPTPGVNVRREDFFGNLTHCFAIEESHKSLSITVTSNVQVSPGKTATEVQDTPWEVVRDAVREGADPTWLNSIPFVFASPRVPIAPEYRAYAQESFDAGGGLMNCVGKLTKRIHEEFAYDPVATNVDTPVHEVFEKRRGVCQDFAHFELACLRSIGLPARYVSGYLKTIPPEDGAALVGADQSHAWVAVYCGEAQGWIEFDPTNDCVCSLDHIPIAWGRDYGDVVPVRGVFLGGGHHQLSVSVHVEPSGNGSAPDK